MPEYLSLSLSLTHSLTLSHFNGHHPGEPGLARAGTRMSLFWILLELRMMEVVVITGAVICAQLQSNHQHQQTNRPDGLPVTQPTLSQHSSE